MATTSRYPVTVDGVRMDNHGFNVETKNGRDLGIGVQGDDISSGLRDGDIWTPHKKASAGRFVLQMWVAGADADGFVPTDNYKQYRDNLDYLKRIFGVRHRLLDVRQQLDDAGTSIRQALCEVTAMIDPDMLSNFPYTSRFAVEFKILAGFWQDVADSNYDSAIGLITNTDINLPIFAPSTAPIRNMWAVLDGPATNPKLIDNRNGHYAILNGTIGNGIQWCVDTTNWTSKTGAAIAFTNTGTDAYAITSFAGGHAPKIFGITADPTGPQVRIEGSGFGANTRLRLRAKNQYL